MSYEEILLIWRSLLNKFVKSKYFLNILILVISLLIFANIAEDVVTKDEIIYYDKIIVNNLNIIANHYSSNLAFFITNFGSIDVVSLILFVLATVLILKKHDFSAFLLLSSTIGGGILNIIVKNIFDRTRPVVGTPITHEIGYSFPSGHSMTAMCFYGAMVYLIFTHFHNIKLKWLLIVILSALILLIGLSRVYLGVHYPSDVFGGFFLGLFWLDLCVIIYKKLKFKTVNE